ncbi:putative yippee-like protein [Dioszegia hungarica]|uniref:Protein yippee-like n=1 Tax=Dioszegia hungarica TaxID=4972 RepID=A0AA38LWI0_9TREE|nr:putative yippee-like protein [Dioszegia hungarica]KAI9636541.1 putative yippee-like protein [Dioszegia hungarica]
MSSAGSSSTSQSASPSLVLKDTARTTGVLNLHYVPDDKPVFSCEKCSDTVALQDELVSKAFNGRSGRAYLFNTTINTNLGKREERKLITGMHTVADLLCASCDTSLGWMYIRAPTGDQRYKEGRYILEAAKVVKENNW